MENYIQDTRVSLFNKNKVRCRHNTHLYLYDGWLNIYRCSILAIFKRTYTLKVTEYYRLNKSYYTCTVPVNLFLYLHDYWYVVSLLSSNKMKCKTECISFNSYFEYLYYVCIYWNYKPLRKNNDFGISLNIPVQNYEIIVETYVEQYVKCILNINYRKICQIAYIIYQRWTC